MKKITIAIDGFSSTGKSTLAKQLANQLGYAYVDTGAMYRAVTYFAMKNGWVTEIHLNTVEVIKNLSSVNLEFRFNEQLGFAEMFLNQVNIENEIRTIEVSRCVSKIAEISEVRAMLVKQQQQMGKNKAVVMDGRDIGTVVFPEAELKLYLTASADTRAHRRYKELIDRGDKVHFDAVLKNVQERDYIDSHRATSPLKKAEGAVEIDNSDMGLEEQFERILSHANALIAF